MSFPSILYQCLLWCYYSVCFLFIYYFTWVSVYEIAYFLPIGAGTMWIFVSLITTAQSNGDSILLGLSFGERYQPGHGNS